MPVIPWRVACQRVEIQREGDPIAALDFMGNLNGAETTRLRILATPGDGDHASENIELEFTTGGYLLGYVFQPRWLKPYERPNMSNADVRRDVAFRKASWEAGQNGGEAPSRKEFDENWTDEEGYDPDKPHREPTSDEIEKAEQASRDGAIAAAASRKAREDAGLPVEPLPVQGAASVVRPNEGVPGSSVITDDPDPVRANKAGQDTTQGVLDEGGAEGGNPVYEGGPDAVPAKGVTTTDSLKGGAKRGK